jgi:hypothetical protein
METELAPSASNIDKVTPEIMIKAKTVLEFSLRGMFNCSSKINLVY